MENELYFTSSALESGAEPGKDYGVKLPDLKRDKDGGWENLPKPMPLLQHLVRLLAMSPFR
jgi:hypothetical protein